MTIQVTLQYQTPPPSTTALSPTNPPVLHPRGLPPLHSRPAKHIGAPEVEARLGIPPVSLPRSLADTLAERVQRLGVHVAVHAPPGVGKAGAQRSLAAAEALGRLFRVVVDDEDVGELFWDAVGSAVTGAGGPAGVLGWLLLLLLLLLLFLLGLALPNLELQGWLDCQGLGDEAFC